MFDLAARLFLAVEVMCAWSHLSISLIGQGSIAGLVYILGRKSRRDASGTGYEMRRWPRYLASRAGRDALR